MATTAVASTLQVGTSPAVALQGYDTFTGAGRDPAVTGKTVDRAARTQSGYTVCKSTQELLETLQISTQLAASSPAAKVDAKMDYFHSLKVSETSVAVAVYVNKTTADTIVTEVQLADGVEAPTADNLNAWFHEHGDSYVSELTLGGEYMATYVFYSQSTTEQEEVVASLHANGLAAGGTIDASMQTSIKKTQETLDTRTAFTQDVLGYSNLTPPTDEAGMVAFCAEVAATTPDMPAVIKFETTGYEYADASMLGVMAPIAETRELFCEGKLPSLSGDAATLQGLLTQTDWIESVYKTYAYTGDSDLATKRAQAQADHDALWSLIKEIQKNPTASYERPQLESLTYGLPVLQVSTPRLDATWGGGGGGPFFDASRKSVIERRRVAQVVLRTGKYVDAIVTTYESADGGIEQTHHGKGGHESAPLELGPGDTITSLSGRSGRVVDHLDVYASDGASIGGGGGGGGSFSWSVPAGDVVIGFGGRSGEDLDRIGPITCHFSPAIWEQP